MHNGKVTGGQEGAGPPLINTVPRGASKVAAAMGLPRNRLAAAAICAALCVVTASESAWKADAVGEAAALGPGAAGGAEDGLGAVGGWTADGWSPVLRKLQDNATNVTAEVITECVQAIRDLGDIEQCEISYRVADCPEAKKKNWVAWTTVSSPAVCLYIFGVLVMFLSLSIVCDEYFVPGKSRSTLVP